MTKTVEPKQMDCERLDDNCGLRAESINRRSRGSNDGNARFCFPVALAALTGAGVFTVSAQEDATRIVADQIRAQGYKWDFPQSAKQDRKPRSPTRTVWILQCESGSYRVRLIPDMAAKVEKIDQSKDKSQ